MIEILIDFVIVWVIVGACIALVVARYFMGGE